MASCSVPGGRRRSRLVGYARAGAAARPRKESRRVLHVSITANAWFLLLVLLVAAAFVWAAGPGSRGPGESSRATARWAAVAMVIAAAWLAVSAVIAATGILRAFSLRPPPLLIFLALVTLATTAVAFSPVGTRLVHGLGIAGLVGFQVFRVP